MAKTKLVFDATADIDNVGAWVRAGTDGDRIGSQTVNAEEWLNTAATLRDETGAAISSANPLPVDIQDASIAVDLDHTNDSVRLGDGTSFLTSTTVGADIGLDVNLINASVAVTATDLDIRDLSAAQDSVAISDGTDSLDINADGSINITDNGGSLTVDAIDFDIRDLTAASDSVASHLFDGAGTALTSTLVGSDQALDVNVVNAVSSDDTANTACSFSATSVDNTVGGTDLAATDLTGRKYLFLYNNGNQAVFIGESGVTTATGFPVEPGSYLMMRAGASCDLHAISATGAAQDIRIAELS